MPAATSASAAFCSSSETLPGTTPPSQRAEARLTVATRRPEQVGGARVAIAPVAAIRAFLVAATGAVVLTAMLAHALLVRLRRPFLAICVGLQLLYERSEESPGVAGLGVLPGEVQLTRSYWLITHPDTHDLARVQACSQFLIEQAQASGIKLKPENVPVSDGLSS